MAERDRLKQVHQTDLIESRINEDLVEWLKTKGPSWLLMILVGVAIWMGYFRWREYKASHYNEAWSALLDCRLPGSFEDVAARYADVPGLPQQAKRGGADVLLAAVQTDSPLGADPAAVAPATGLTDLEREEYLSRAERLYQEVIATDDDTLSMTIHAVSALQGMAVVAESLGNAEEARRWYESAAVRADPYYPWLAEQARKRAATAEEYAVTITLPDQADLPQPPPAEPLQPVVIDEALRELLLPDDSGQG
ncbi:MAG: hypothetical protein ACYS15_09070 [Planctomycetota bacterium]|jgi:tetratricopeptide (TPR) repeat protein